MLVALTVALVWEKHPTMPRWGRIASLAVVGGVLASAFRPSVLPLISRHWMPVALVVCGTLLLSLGAGLLLSVLVRLDRKTAVLGALPGAASGMLAMSGPLGADARLVALMQYTRVVVVVVSATLVGRLGLVPGTSPAAGLGARPAGDPETADLLVQGLPDDVPPDGPGSRTRRLGRVRDSGCPRARSSDRCFWGSPSRSWAWCTWRGPWRAAGGLPHPRVVGRVALRR